MSNPRNHPISLVSDSASAPSEEALEVSLEGSVNDGDEIEIVPYNWIGDDHPPSRSSFARTTNSQSLRKPAQFLIRETAKVVSATTPLFFFPHILSPMPLMPSPVKYGLDSCMIALNGCVGTVLGSLTEEELSATNWGKLARFTLSSACALTVTFGVMGGGEAFFQLLDQSGSEPTQYGRLAVGLVGYSVNYALTASAMAMWQQCRPLLLSARAGEEPELYLSQRAGQYVLRGFNVLMLGYAITEVFNISNPYLRMTALSSSYIFDQAIRAGTKMQPIPVSQGFQEETTMEAGEGAVSPASPSKAHYSWRVVGGMLFCGVAYGTAYLYQLMNPNEADDFENRAAELSAATLAGVTAACVAEALPQIGNNVKKAIACWGSFFARRSTPDVEKDDELLLVRRSNP